MKKMLIAMTALLSLNTFAGGFLIDGTWTFSGLKCHSIEGLKKDLNDTEGQNIQAQNIIGVITIKGNKLLDLQYNGGCGATVKEYKIQPFENLYQGSTLLADLVGIDQTESKSGQNCQSMDKLPEGSIQIESITSNSMEILNYSAQNEEYRSEMCDGKITFVYTK